MRRVGIVGSTDYPELDEVYSFVKDLRDCLIVTGNAKGVCRVATQAAHHARLEVEIHRADWERYPGTAGMNATYSVMKNCDSLIVFWTGKDKYFPQLIDQAKKKGKDTVLIMPIDSSYVDESELDWKAIDPLSP